MKFLIQILQSAEVVAATEAHPLLHTKEMSSLHSYSTNPAPAFSCHHHHHSSCKPNSTHHKLQWLLSRRAAAATLATALLAREAFSTSNTALSFELRFTVPDQTPEEAYATIKAHAWELLQIKLLIDSQSWREAQLALRESSALLKQDIYTIIQARPGSQRPELRKLYSNLFHSVSRQEAKMQLQCSNAMTTLLQLWVRFCQEYIELAVSKLIKKEGFKVKFSSFNMEARILDCSPAA